MSPIQQLEENLRQFRDERDWMKYHTPKDLAISIVLESSELLEHFQWKDAEASAKHVEKKREEILDEMADILKYLLHLSDVLNVDLVERAIEKLKRDGAKYPVEAIKGDYKKYTEIEQNHV